MSREYILKSYLRRSDTLLAKTVSVLGGGYKGERYRESTRRFIMHAVLKAALALAAKPTVEKWERKIKEAGYEPRYRQARVSRLLGYDEQGEPIFGTDEIEKLQTMVPGADKFFTAEEIVKINQELGEHADPRLIPGIGAQARKAKVDELPQLDSKLPLIAPRSIPKSFLMVLKAEMSKERYEQFLTAYFSGEKIAGGIIPPVAAVDVNNKSDWRAAGHAIFYGREASLGYDLFILYSVFVPAILERIRRQIPSPIHEEEIEEEEKFVL